MRNFYRLTTGMDVMPGMLALNEHPQFWNGKTERTKFKGSPHWEADDIYLRAESTVKVEENELYVLGQKDCVNCFTLRKMPQFRALIFALMASVQGERLGRCIITRLAPGKQIYPHRDIDSTKKLYFSRFHIVLQGLPGCLFRCGDDEVNMRTGEVWWINNAEEHSVVNNSIDDRIHLIVDIKTSK